MNSVRNKFYTTFSASRSSRNDRKQLSKETLYNLYKMPKRDKGDDIAHTVNYEPYHTYQADLLTMPTDEKGYKYILVVVDINTGKTDGEGLRTKNSLEVMKAFKKIFDRKILKKPVVIKTDSGGEFQGEVKQWMDKNKIVQKTALPSRHRQVSKVEKRNGTIAKALFQRMVAEELITNQPSTDWYDDLPLIIKEINKHAKAQPTEAQTEDIKTGKDGVNMLDIGQKVRVQLDYPIDVVTKKKLGDVFRKTDIRWDPEIKTITNYILKPDMPVLYVVDNNNRVAYTKNQLQVVSKDELEPEGEKVVRGNIANKTFIVKEILGEKKIKGKKYYLVLYKGYKNPEYTEAKLLKEDQPELVARYEKSKNN